MGQKVACIIYVPQQRSVRASRLVLIRDLACQVS